jgi:hypothetical protein
MYLSIVDLRNEKDMFKYSCLISDEKSCLVAFTNN